jgi:uncharacterized protein (DUF2237 family)
LTTQGTDLTACKSNPTTSPSFYRDGCLEKAKVFLKTHGTIIGGVGIAVAIIMVSFRTFSKNKLDCG